MKKLLFIVLLLSANAFANPDEKVASLGIELVPKGEPTASYVYAVQTGNLLFLAGHVSVDQNGKVITGKLGKDLTTEQGAHAARMAGVSILSTLKQQLGSLSRVKKFVKVTGMVNASPDFSQHSQVINGFSDIMVEVFGKAGQHARSAVGMSSLPVNAAVEIEVIVEVE
jgi:enamine deaminase RidA (YjgF/YER057c/UK114 family)